MSTETKIALDNLSISYGKKAVVKNFCLSVPSFKITAILGQSGCGKTTLLKGINRIVEEDNGKISGDILIDGQTCGTMDTQSLRKRVGMVFQMPIVFPCSVADNILYAHGYHFDIPKAERGRVVEKYLSLVNLYDEVKDQLSHSAFELSGGQQQRLAIARSLCTEPEVLMLDEPCSALDMMNSIKIEKLLLSLKERYTILIVTHNLSQAKRIADNIVFMDGGELIEAATAESFFREPVTEKAKKYVAYMEH